MAFLGIQRGELTDRLRRFFNIVGSYQGSVDELVSPVVLGQRLDQSPYRREGYQWHNWQNRNAPAAGQVNVGRYRFGNTSAGGGVFTVERIVLWNQDAANPIVAQLGTTGRSTLAGAYVAVTGELPPPPAFGQTTTPLYVSTVTTAVFPVGNSFARFRIPANSIIQLDVGFTVRPEAELVIENTIAALPLGWYITGKIFQQGG